MGVELILAFIIGVGGFVAIITGITILLIGVVRFCRGKGRGAMGKEKATRIGRLQLVAVVNEKNVRLTCCKCGRTFPNGTGRYKIVKDGEYNTVLSVCCNAECYFMHRQIL